MSVAPANNTWRMTWPVDGFVTSPRRVPCDGVRTPPIQKGTSAPIRADDSARMALVGPMVATPESGGGLRHDARKTIRHHVQRLVELIVGHHQRRQKPDDVAKGAGRDEQDAALTGLADDLLR